MSSYVQRCQRCKTVRGRTAFPVVRAGQRSVVCRWCDEQQTTRRLYVLQLRADRLARQLAAVRAEVRRIRGLVAADRALAS